VFSKKADGTARLEKKVDDAWHLLEDAPKEASKKAKEVLGADASGAGLNQLLWLDQGEVELPEAKKLDASLRHQLERVLGTMVTGRDSAFKVELDKLYAELFTQGGELKKNSAVKQAEKKKEERANACADLQMRFHQLEKAIGQLESCEDGLPALQRAVREA